MPKYIASNASVKVNNLSEYLNARKQQTEFRPENEVVINEGCGSLTECIILSKKTRYLISQPKKWQNWKMFSLLKKYMFKKYMYVSLNLGGTIFLKYCVSKVASGIGTKLWGLNQNVQEIGCLDQINFLFFFF